MLTDRRRRRQGAADSGVTLVECMAALFVFFLVALAVGAAVGTSANATRVAGQNQTAGDLLNRQLESLRSHPFAAITMVSSDSTLASDLNITTSHGSQFYDAGQGPEQLVVASVGLVNPHTVTDIENGTTYNISTYITCPSGSPGCLTGSGVQYRRATVVAQWTSGGISHSRRDSTMLVNTRTGLPLPYFKLSGPKQSTANVGGDIQVQVSVQNLGARDAWNFALPAGSWTWYYDSNNDGTLEKATDTQMTTSNYDSDGNGVIDTGLIDSGYTKTFFAVRTATINDVGTTSITVTATSAAQPTASTASQSLTESIKTASDYCPGCTSAVTYLHNYTSKIPGTSGATKAVSAMAQDQTSPVNTTLYDYSTDLNATAAGRTVLTGGSGVSENNLTKVAVWQRQMSNTCTLPATAVASITIWAMPTTGSSGAFDVYIGSDNNTQIGGFASAGKASYSSTAWSGGFQSITVSIPINTAFSITKNNAVEVRVEVPSTSASSMLFAYDTTTYTANAHLPFSSSSCL